MPCWGYLKNPGVRTQPDEKPAWQEVMSHLCLNCLHHQISSNTDILQVTAFCTPSDSLHPCQLLPSLKLLEFCRGRVNTLQWLCTLNYTLRYHTEIEITCICCLYFCAFFCDICLPQPAVRECRDTWQLLLTKPLYLASLLLFSKFWHQGKDINVSVCFWHRVLPATVMGKVERD